VWSNYTLYIPYQKPLSLPIFLRKNTLTKPKQPHHAQPNLNSHTMPNTTNNQQLWLQIIEDTTRHNTRGAMFSQQWHHAQLKHLRIENNLAMNQPI
jgi:hypothetical protein